MGNSCKFSCLPIAVLPVPHAALAHVHMRLAADWGAAAHHRAAAQLHGPSTLAHGVGMAVGTGVPRLTMGTMAMAPMAVAMGEEAQKKKWCKIQVIFNRIQAIKTGGVVGLGLKKMCV